jgi:hypothetical protein
MKLKTAFKILTWIYLSAGLVYTGWMVHELETMTSRARLAYHLGRCGYVPHPIADVTWELVRIGAIPVGTASYYSALVTSKNIPASALKACMGEIYG